MKTVIMAGGRGTRISELFPEIAYCNMLADGKCGLGFEVEEVTETSAGFSIAVQPVDECTVAMPRTRKDFVKKAAERGIEWDLSDVVTKSMIM